MARTALDALNDQDIKQRNYMQQASTERHKQCGRASRRPGRRPVLFDIDSHREGRLRALRT